MFGGIENCNLKFGAYLEFGAWNLGFSKLCDHFEHNIFPKSLICFRLSQCLQERLDFFLGKITHQTYLNPVSLY